MKRFLKPGWIFLFAVIGYGCFVAFQLSLTYLRSSADGERIRQIVASEELVLELNSDLGRLARSVRNLQLPDDQSVHLFQPTVSVANLGALGDPHAVSPTGSIDATLSYWTIEEPHETDAGDVQLWQSLIESVSYWDHAKFYFIRGEFEDDSLSHFKADVGFKGLARRTDGQWAGVKGKLVMQWINNPAIDTPNPTETAAASKANEPSHERLDNRKDHAWRIAAWHTKELKSFESHKLLFTETLDSAIPNANELRNARTSAHEEAVRAYYNNGAQRLPWEYFSPISANQRPGVSVVDIDNDGFDDVYVMVRRGPNQLLRNRGDGTFEEVAHQWGLDIEHFSSCGVFADFDNDGDADLVLGRSVAPSLYLRNEGSRFEAVPDHEAILPQLVVSMSAADYNGDGLLDLYVSTYRPAVLESLISDEGKQNDQEDKLSSAKSKDGGPNGAAEAGGLEAVGEQSKRWTERFLSPPQSEEYERRLATSKNESDRWGKILDQVGPPNVLLVNRGGRFEVAPESAQVAAWRNTLQATWADFDEDGDPDLYVANDWARDNLLRNDGAAGFTDITSEMNATEFGFAMGATWGDYDLDGRQDLYVSNMFSKAGRRITSQIAELNPNFQRSVVGNYLYRNKPDGFELVSGLEKPKLTVAEAGWSWGGQFSDFDNDGFLDLYVLSGYFSAPDEFASDVDL